MTVRNDAVFKRLHYISEFINSTTSDDVVWNEEQGTCNRFIEEIKHLLICKVNFDIVKATLIKARFTNIDMRGTVGKVYISARREDNHYGRDFLEEDLALQADPMQYIVDWFRAHKLKELE